MIRTVIVNKCEIQKEVQNITLDMVKSSHWLDKDTWINWAIEWTDSLKTLFKDFFKFDSNATEEEKDYWLCIEYWKDEDKIQYLLQCDTESININELIACDFIDNLVIEAVKRS